jgi:Na+-driven multidrug efflux pump
MRIGIPTAIEHLGWVLAFLVSVRVTAQLGAQAMATHTYVLQITSAVILVGVSTGLAVEVLVGRMIGAGHFRHAYHFANRSLALGMLLSGLTALIAAMFGQSLLQIFTKDPEIIALGMTLMWIGVIVEPGRTINIVMNDALRAVGDARFPAVASLPTMAIALAFGSWWLGIHLGLGLVGVWLAYLADEWLRGIVNFGRWFFKGWIPAAQISRRHSRLQQ